MNRRLIDADDALRKIQKAINEVRGNRILALKPEDCYKLMRKVLKDAPTIDAVEVIRCKECGKKPTCKHTRSLGINGYCSEGERKEAT